MPVPPTGTEITINEVQKNYGLPNETNRSLGALGASVGITPGDPISLSQTFGGQ